MDKQFDGLIHTKIQTLINMPQYQGNTCNNEKLKDKFKELEDKINNIDFVDEEEMQQALDDIEIISGGNAPSEKGE